MAGGFRDLMTLVYGWWSAAPSLGATTATHEYTLPTMRPHYTLPDRLDQHTLPTMRPHYTLPDEN